MRLNDHSLKISIITVSYNAGKTIEQTLESVFSQDYKNIEYIVVDGKSSDNTLSVIKKYRDSIDKFISEEDEGIYDAMNKGIALTNGDIIGILNADDLYYDESTLKNIVVEFEKDPLLDAIYGHLYYFRGNESSKPVRFWRSKDFNSSFFEDGYSIPHPTLFVRKKVYDKFGVYFPKFKISSDYEFCLRAFGRNELKIKNINQIVVKMRLGGESTSSLKNIILGNQEIVESWRMNKRSIPFLFFFNKVRYKIMQFV